MLECFALFLVVYLQRIKSTQASTVDASHTRPVSSGELQAVEEETALLAHTNHSRYSSADNQGPPHRARFSREISKSEVQRGKILSFVFAAVIVAAWILFMTTAWTKLGQKKAH